MRSRTIAIRDANGVRHGYNKSVDKNGADSRRER